MTTMDLPVAAHLPTLHSPDAKAMDALRYRGPAVNAEGVVIDQFVIDDSSLENLMSAIKHGRGTAEGTYWRLLVDGRLWMSDTDAECRDHMTPVFKARDWGQFGGATGLINGLGLGCVLGAWIDVLDHVDVVESDERVARLIGGWYEHAYPGKVTVHHGDAYDIVWPRGTTWSLAWHDIWPGIGSDNLDGMTRLHRRYANRVQWQGSWCKWLCQRQRRAGY